MVLLLVTTSLASPRAATVCVTTPAGPVAHDAVFDAGARISLTVTPPGDGFLYVAARDPKNEVALLFPWLGEANAVTAAPVLIPPEGEELELSGPAQRETVWLVWSPQALASKEDVLSLLATDEIPAEAEVLASAAAPDEALASWFRVVPNVKAIQRVPAQPSTEAQPCAVLPLEGESALVGTLSLEHR